MEWQNKSKWSLIILVVVTALLSSTATYFYIHSQDEKIQQTGNKPTNKKPTNTKSAKRDPIPQLAKAFHADNNASIEQDGNDTIDLDESFPEPQNDVYDDETSLDTTVLWWLQNQNEYTPMGAKRAGSDDLSIPQWTGSIFGVPNWLEKQVKNHPYADPYADEKPLFTLTYGNYLDYKAYLSEGIVALFERHSTTFAMPIYPSHRDFYMQSLC